MSRLVMPMGFCAILGGTMTMVASSPLIMLNDLIGNANRNLESDQLMQKFDLFSVTPVGVALVACGLLFFLLFGKYVLPKGTTVSKARGTGTVRYMRRLHGVHAAVREVEVPVVPARAEERWVSDLVPEHDHGGVEPRQGIVCQRGAQELEQPPFLGLGNRFIAEPELLVRLMPDFNRGTERLEAGVA